MVGYVRIIYATNLNELNNKINNQIETEYKDKKSYVTDIHIVEPIGYLTNLLYVARLSFTNDVIRKMDVYERTRGCTNPIIIDLVE